jgi:chemotaxis signal transduction protein
MGEPLGADSGLRRHLLSEAARDGASVAAGDQAAALDDMLQRLQLGQFAVQGAFEPQYLLFECGGTGCAVSLAELREVRNGIPRTIPLPGSPDWMLGIFPVRSEMLALVDPIPALFGVLEQAPPARLAQLPAPDLEHASVLIIGTGERSVALVIDTYSGTPTIPSQELDTSAQTLASTGLPIAAHYVAGIYRPADADRTYMVLQAEHLLSDLIAALEEADESNG